jgi:hypothetical protein
MPFTPESLHKRLEEVCGLPIRLRLNRNVSQLISVRHPTPQEPPLVSVHRAFLDAGDNVIRALAQYIRHPTPACRRTLRLFIDSIPTQHFRSAARRVRLRSRGSHYDLDRILRDVVDEYFDGQMNVAITWGRNGKPVHRRRRHIQLGCYLHHQRLIRIHPLLDSPDVPEFFVRFIVYHELLHARLEHRRDSAGRRQLHTPEFRRLEKLFPQYAEAVAFERRLLDSL